MKYNIALIPPCNLEEVARNAKAGKCPGHIIWELSQLLEAKVYQPGSNIILPIDKICAKIIASPEHWAFARQVSSQLQEDDIIYCNGEQIGIPIATLCAAKPKRPKIISFINNMNRPRGHLALKLFKAADRIDLFVTDAPPQAEFLRNYMNLPEDRVYLLSAPPIDTSFFTPGLASPNKLRPVIGSGGLEKRDYKTLAEATKDLNIDVKICAFSRSAPLLKRTLPKVLPSNMSSDFYDWCELLQLYCDSDIVVIPLFENDCHAGLTTLFEALACKRPVIITRSSGIINNLIDSNIVTGVNPRDPVGLKQAIEKLLNNPQQAAAQAERGYELVLSKYNHSSYLNSLVTRLCSTYGMPSFDINFRAILNHA